MRTTKGKATKVYEQIVRVSISGVPFDMMRYDNCVPRTESDSYKLERIASSGRADDSDRVVEFRRFSHVDQGPTEGRWRSFNCTVISWERVTT